MHVVCFVYPYRFPLHRLLKAALQSLPFVRRVHQQISGDRQRQRVPLHRSSFKGQVRAFHHDDDIHVAADAPVASGVGAKVADALDA